jgi:hypothetical protein
MVLLNIYIPLIKHVARTKLKAMFSCEKVNACTEPMSAVATASPMISAAGSVDQ